jgi:DNA polymerase I-like protein with 3'-5' exonuclease and polymerase domains
MLTIDNPSKFDWANMSLSDCCEGNAMDTYFTLKLFDLIMEKLEGQPVMNLIENVVMPSLETFAEMEYNGLDVDLDALDSVGKQLRATNMDEEDFLYTCKSVTKTDNLSSNNDLIEILYTREDGMELYPPDKTAKGKPSVSAPTLKLLLEHIDAELESRG